jgi:RHS repeat-associated protein
MATGYGYDAAGDVTSDGPHTYTYDAEGRITTVSGSGASAAYVYNAEGQRVRRTNSGVSVDYLYDLAGHAITELNSSGGWNRGEVYAGGMHVATYMGGTGGTTYFTHSDWLGTERVRTSLNGAIYSTWTSLPFGEGSSTPNPGPTHFTGKERDVETGNDYFGARYYGASTSRFMSPDPLFVNLRRLNDPQQLNLYSYVRNNPLRYTDPTGLDLWLRGCGKESTTCHRDYVGTWDTSHKRFEPTTIQSDKNGNFSGHKVSFDTAGIHVDGKYQGVFASGTNATAVQGSGKLSGFTGTFTSNCLGTCTAVGTITPGAGHSLDELTSILTQIRGEGLFTKHEGIQLRGGNDEGPDVHVSFVEGQSFDSMHFDWRYPGTLGGLRQHRKDAAAYDERSKTMKSDPSYEQVGPQE